ncbi:MAG: tRNA uracil 4-sulfurtransferase ThiI [Candidatus Peregrinibacteria bacterium]|nr:tRNA uracil 4-sulfurtransferase ThiI [Candidatus Peregrinibacteria bacterium]
MPKAVARYHEIALKGGNRSFFESRLHKNMERVLEGVDGARVVRERDQLIVHFDKEDDQEEVKIRLKKVFGIVHFFFVDSVKSEMSVVAKRSVELVKETLEGLGLREDEMVTFRVVVNRRDKSLGKNSMQLARELAGLVLPELENLKVDLSRPRVKLYVDWAKDEVMIYANKIPGPGGLPVGTAGKVVSLLSSGFDSPVASWMLMRRGAKVIFVHFHSYPAVGHESIDNVERIVEILDQYQGHSKLYLIPLNEYQKFVVAKAPAPLRVLLYRRMMVRLAERVMRYESAKALVTGESLAQVASQTLDNLHVVDTLASRPVFRPLIGMDKQEIIEWSGVIGTEEISKQPYEDCCSLYVPKTPALAAKPYELEEAETNLEIEKFENLLWEQREVKKFDLGC